MPSRRDSVWSTSSSSFNIPDPSSGYKGKNFYTARVVVPIALPKGNKCFVPTFHSCLMSRVYGLDLYISIQTPYATVKDPTVHLKIPIQISAEGRNIGELPRAMSAQEINAIASHEVDEIFNTRSVAPPSSELMGRALLDGLSSARANDRRRQVSTFEDLSSPRIPPQRRVSFAEDTPPMPGPG